MINRYNRNATYHGIELENIYVLMKHGKYNKAKMFLEEYKDKFGEEHAIYKKVYAMLEGFFNDDLDTVIKLHEELLYEVHLFDRGEIILNLAYLYIKRKDYLSAYILLERTDIDSFDLKHPEFVTRFYNLFDFVRKHMDLYDEGYNIHYDKYDIDYSMRKIIISNSPNHAFDYIIDEDVDYLLELYNYMISKIGESKKTFDYTFADRYFFRIKNIGVSLDGKRTTDILKIVTFPNTNRVITMYPVGSRLKDNRVINECDFNKEEKEYTRVRTSQIDKFNKKWGSR